MESLLDQLNQINITSSLPQEFSTVGADDERARLYKSLKIAEELLGSSDEQTRVFFKQSMKNIYEHYLREINFNPSAYNLKNYNQQQIQAFMTTVQTIQTKLTQYTQFSDSWDTNMSLTFIIQTNKLIIEFINPISELQLDLSGLSI